MSVKLLLKERMSERLDRAATINFPENVRVSYCKSYTNSVIKHTAHGVVRCYVVTEA